MGFSYFLRRAQEALKKLTIAANTITVRNDFENGMRYLRCSDLDWSGLTSDRLKTFKSRARVRGVKYRCPCDDPVTPGLDRVSDIFRRDSSVDFNRQRNP